MSSPAAASIAVVNEYVYQALHVVKVFILHARQTNRLAEIRVLEGRASHLTLRETPWYGRGVHLYLIECVPMRHKGYRFIQGIPRGAIHHPGG